MTRPAIFQMILADGSVRVATGGTESGPQRILDPGVTIDELVRGGSTALDAALQAAGEPPDGPFDLVAPLQSQPVWASGVTYLRSRVAREEESDSPDFYERVYDAARPELFVKAVPGSVVGPGGQVGIRGDSTWDVPEPELALVMDPRGRICALTIGNDMSSRSIEGENPLYLAQAKVYERSCAIGPALVPVGPDWSHLDLTIDLRIRRDDTAVFQGRISAAEMKRPPRELADWLFRCQAHPNGAVLLTGTGVVPESDFTLAQGDMVDIAITGLGVLSNPVIEIPA
jgi:2-dehydro-3-deoxy-D-arabinonate dehydratase